MQKIEDGIRAMALASGGASPSVLELAASAKMLAEAGGDTNLMLTQLEHGANLATATQTDLGTTLDFVGSAMRTFGIESDDTQSTVDSLAKVTTLANLELSQIGQSFVNAGGAASNAGMTLHDVNAVLIAFSEHGLKGGRAGTALNAVLSDLQTPSQQAASEFERLGIALFDSEGASRDVFDVMGELETALSGMTDEQRAATESTLFGQVAQKGWNVIMEEGVDYIRETAEYLADLSGAFDGYGQAAGMAGVQSNNLAGDLGNIKSVAEDLSIAFYQSIQEPLREVATSALGYVERLADAFMEDGLSGAIAVIGEVLADVVADVSARVPQFVELGIELITGLADGLGQNSAAIISSATEAFNTFIDGIRTLLPQLVPLAVEVITVFASGFITVKELIFTTGVEILADLIAGISSKLPELIPQAQEAIMNIANGLAENLPKILQSGIDIIVQLALGIAETLPELIPVAIEAILTLVMTLLENVDQLAEAAVALIMGLADGLMTALPILIEKAPIIITQLVMAMIELLPKLAELAVLLIHTLVTGLVGSLPEIMTIGGKIVETLLRAIGLDRLADFVEVGTNIVKAFWQGISDLITWIYDNAKNFALGVINAVKGIFGISSPSTVFMEMGKNLVRGLWNGIKALGGWIKGQVSDFFGNVISTAKGIFGISSPSTVFSGIGTDVVTGFENGVSDLPEKTNKHLNNTLNKVTEWGGDLVRQGTERAENFLSTVTGTVESLPGKVSNAISPVIENTAEWGRQVAAKGRQGAQDMRRDVVSEGEGLVDSMTSVGSNIVNGVWSGIQSVAQTFRTNVSGFFSGIVSQVKGTLQISSPSQVFAREVGRAIPQGVAQGIDADADKARQAADRLAQDTFRQAKVWIEQYRLESDYLATEELKMWEHLSGMYVRGTKQRLDADKEAARLRQRITREDFEYSKAWIERKKFFGIISTREELEAWERVQARFREGTKEREEADRTVFTLRNRLRAEDFQSIKDGIERERFFRRMTLEEEFVVWEAIQDRYKEGTREREEVERTLFTLRDRLREEDFKNFKDHIEREKFFRRMTLEEEYEAWAAIQERYKEGTKEREEVERTIFTLRNSLAAEDFKNITRWIDLRKEHNKISMQEEIDFWKKQTELYLEGTEQREEADRRLFDSQRRLFEEQEKLTQRMADAEERYQNAVDSRAQSIFNTFGLFDELREKEEVSTQTLKENLQAQVSEMANWASNIDRLARKGIDEGLLAELRAMGPKANAEIAALSTMSEAELTAYSNLWKEKHEIARVMAIRELEHLREETDAEIRELADQLNELADTEFVFAGRNTVDGFIDGIRSGFGGLKESMEEMARIAVETAQNALRVRSPSEIFEDIGKNVSEGFIYGIESMHGVVKKAVEKAFGDFDDMPIGIKPYAQAKKGMADVSAYSRMMQTHNDGNTYILQVKMDEIDEVNKLKQVFENFSHNKIVFEGGW